MITIQIDEKKYNKIVDDVENSLDFTLYDDYQTFAVGFEESTFWKEREDFNYLFQIKEDYNV